MMCWKLFIILNDVWINTELSGEERLRNCAKYMSKHTVNWTCPFSNVFQGDSGIFGLLFCLIHVAHVSGRLSQSDW